MQNTYYNADNDQVYTSTSNKLNNNCINKNLMQKLNANIFQIKVPSYQVIHKKSLSQGLFQQDILPPPYHSLVVPKPNVILTNKKF